MFLFASKNATMCLQIMSLCIDITLLPSVHWILKYVFLSAYLHEVRILLSQFCTRGVLLAAAAATTTTTTTGGAAAMATTTAIATNYYYYYYYYCY